MKTASSDSPKPTGKKLKQATLSFAPISKAKYLTSESNKRKKSESDEDGIQVLKVLCSDKNNAATEQSIHEKSPIAAAVEIIPAKENIIDHCEAEVMEVDPVKEDVEGASNNDFDSKQGSSSNDIADSKEDETAAEDAVTVDSDENEKEESPSSPLSLCNDKTSDEEADSSALMDSSFTESVNTTINVSALLDGDDNDKDSVISFSDIPITPAKTPSSAAKKNSNKPKKLTPKQVQKQQDVQKRKEEKEREKEERERKKQEEKEARKRQREEKEEQKKQEKLEKEKKRLAEIEQKNEEKRAREEERKKRDEVKQNEKRRKEEEERRKREEKQRAEDEAQKKKEKAAAAFASFFVAKKPETKKSSPTSSASVSPVKLNFMPFCVKAGMKLAPTTRRQLSSLEKQSLESVLASPLKETPYLRLLRSKEVISGKQGKTWPTSGGEDDVQIIDEGEVAGEAVEIGASGSKQTFRAKLLQFHENRRPPYWGTWRKQSRLVRPRNPFGLDNNRFDYEVDSDDEWEEEEPGESLKGSDDEADKESEDEYEVDNEFFVPHGYLSDEEAGEDEAVPPEAQKERLKMMEREFVAEMKHKTTQIKPRILGCFFANDSMADDPVYKQMLAALESFSAKLMDPTPVVTSYTLRSKPGSPEAEGKSKNGKNSAKRGYKHRQVPEEAIPDIIRLIHGNTKSQTFLVREFQAYWDAQHAPSENSGVLASEPESVNDGESPSSKNHSLLSLSNVSKKLKELATWIPCPEEGPLQTRLCWWVPLEVRQAHGLVDLKIPNQWKYTLALKKKKKKPSPEIAESSAVDAEGAIKKEAPRCESPKVSTKLITKFTKTLSEEERLNLLKREETAKPVTVVTPKPPSGLITKFAKQLTEEERQKQMKRKSDSSNITPPKPKQAKLPTSVFSPSSAFNVNGSVKATASSSQVETKSPDSSSNSTASSGTSAEVKKARRVAILVSVPRGQDIPALSKAVQEIEHKSEDDLECITLE